MKISKKDIEKLEKLEESLTGDVVGVRQASDLLQQDIKNILYSLDNKKYEQASDIGYDTLSENFIFLQRCLGGMLRFYQEKQKVIQDIAFENKVSYEQVLETIKKGE